MWTNNNWTETKAKSNRLTFALQHSVAVPTPQIQTNSVGRIHITTDYLALMIKRERTDLYADKPKMHEYYLKAIGET